MLVNGFESRQVHAPRGQGARGYPLIQGLLPNRSLRMSTLDFSMEPAERFPLVVSESLSSNWRRNNRPKRLSQEQFIAMDHFDEKLIKETSK